MPFGTVPTHLAQRNGVHKEEIVVLPAEARVQLLLYDEDNIGRDNVGALVPFLLKGDACALPPPRPHVDGQDLVLDSGGVPVLI